MLLIEKSFQANWNDCWASTLATVYTVLEWQAVKLIEII